MSNIGTMINAKKTSLLLAVLGMAITIAPNTANAAVTTAGPITQMEFNAANTSWPQLALQVNSVATNFYAQQPSPGCGAPALSADTVKSIQTLAQAAFLAGKNVVISYNTCPSGASYIFDLVVQR